MNNQISNPKVEVEKGKYFNIFESISKLQREVYEVMFKKGWYILEQAEQLKIQNKYQMLNQEYQDLNT